VAVKEACGEAHLKVILETGELVTYDNVRRASWIAMLGGADFIKTSTGKVTVNANASRGTRDARSGPRLRRTGRTDGGREGGGGIRTTKDAIDTWSSSTRRSGSTWLTPNKFRFGASSLLNDLLMQRLKQQRGTYVRADEFSAD